MDQQQDNLWLWALGGVGLVGAVGVAAYAVSNREEIGSEIDRLVNSQLILGRKPDLTLRQSAPTLVSASNAKRITFRDPGACRGDEACAALFRGGQSVDLDVDPVRGTVEVVPYAGRRLTPGAPAQRIAFKDPDACGPDEACRALFKYGEYAYVDVDPAAGSVRYVPVVELEASEGRRKRRRAGRGWEVIEGDNDQTIDM